MPKILRKAKANTKKIIHKVTFKIDVLEYFLDLWDDIGYGLEDFLYVQIDRHCKVEFSWLQKGKSLGFVKKVCVNVHDDYYFDVYLNYKKIVDCMNLLKPKEYYKKKIRIENKIGHLENWQKIKNILLN